MTFATPDRSGFKFAQVAVTLAMAYPEAETIHLVLDNLNIHRRKALADVFDAEMAAEVWGSLHFRGEFQQPAKVGHQSWSYVAPGAPVPLYTSDVAGGLLGEVAGWIDRTRNVPTIISRTQKKWIEDFRRLKKLNG